MQFACLWFDLSDFSSVDECIVVNGWAEDNGSFAQNAPFLNAASTKNFQTEKDKGSRWPISEIRTDSDREKIDLPFAVR